MKDQSLRVLIIEDSEDDASLVLRALKKGGYNPVYERVETAAAMKKALKEKQWDIILCDYSLPKFNAPSAIAVLKKANVDIPIIIISGSIGEKTAIECMRLGAKDYFMKGKLSRLCPAIAKELEDAKTRNKEKHMEEKLRREEHRFRSFVEHSLDIIVIMTLEGIVTYLNPAIERALGYKVEERIGANTLEVIHPDDLEYLADKVGILFTETNAPVVQFEVRLRHKDGSWRTFEAVGSNLTHNNVVEAVIVNYRDITERKRMEEALRISEESFKSIVNTSQEWIWAIDAEGRHTFSNPAVESILGYSPDEIIKRGFVVDLIYEEDLPMLTEITIRSFEQKIGWSNMVLRWKHKDGTYRYLESNAVPIFDKAGILKGFQGSDRDITQRKNVEEKLQENERQYRLLTERMSDIVWVADMNLRTIYISPSIKNVLGFSQEERMRQKLDEQLAPHSVSLVLEALSRELALEEQGNADPNRTLTMELEYYHKNGSTRWMELVISGIRNDQGVLTRIHGVSREITERKKAEELLKQSEAQYRLLADHIKDQVWLMDLNLKRKYISPSVEKLLGYNLEELKHLPLDKLLTATSLPAAMDFFSMEMPKALSDPTYSLKRLLELEFRCKDGRTLWIESLFSFIRDENGKPVSILGEGRDITERKRAEEALQRSEERFRSMIQSLSDIIFILDGNGQLTYESPSAARILDYQPGYFIGKSPFTHIHPDDLDQVMKDMDEVFLSVNPGIPTEFRYQKADKTWIYLEALGNNQLKNPGIQGIVLTVSDITKRKKAEEKLQKTLKSLRKAVGTTIQVLVSAIESRDSYTAGHQSRSADLACAIAMEMGLAQEKIEGILMAGIIHDIGKLSMPAEILSKPTRLMEIEFSLIKEHARSGYEMLKDVESPWPLAEIVYQHHERMNGSGYPRNLKGDEILLESQILAVADVVEAMASHRPYRPTLGIKAALEEIIKNKGILYDNTVADACLKLFREKGYQLK